VVEISKKKNDFTDKSLDSMLKTYISKQDEEIWEYTVKFSKKWTDLQKNL